MRLQVSIRRHALPVINIIFTTGTGPSSRTLAPDSTVSDLIQDINDLVPLESTGEWGLEDYAVEVKATADQETYYECLHFQTLDSVLREDDEVVLRCLRTEDLRGRRLGGRHQISADGKHLIDGVTFGKQWLVKSSRPDVAIPPRKRRRTEIMGENEVVDEESTTLLQQIQELGYTNESEDEDEDEDYMDEEEVETDESSEDEMNQQLRIRAVAEFDDADADGSDGSDDDVEDAEDTTMAGNGLELSEELKALLQEAEHLSENGDYYRLPSEATYSPRKAKRKRDGADEVGQEDATDFEGFETPIKPTNVVKPTAPLESSISISNDSVHLSELQSPPGLDSDSDDSSANEDETSSSGSSSSEESDSQTDTSDEDSSSSDSSSESSDEEDTTLKEAELPTSSPAKKASSTANSASSSSLFASTSTSPVTRAQGVPFEGKNATKKNNERTRRRKRLLYLKNMGLLPANATLADLDNMNGGDESKVIEEQGKVDGALESKKMALLQKLHLDGGTEETKSQLPPLLKEVSSHNKLVTEGEFETMGDMNVDRDRPHDQQDPPISLKGSPDDTKATKENPSPKPDPLDIDEPVPSQEIGASAQESFIGKATPKSTEKRAKLDLASSRRMLFNSLGLRTPKTPAAEQALREKLSNSAKSTPQRKAEEKVAERSKIAQADDDNMDSWKDRIALSAAECDYDGAKLSTPPFPFKQGWDSNANMRHGASKKKGRGQSKHNEDKSEDYVAQYDPNVPTLQAKDSQSEQDDRPESRTLSLEEQGVDDMPRPRDFGAALNLDTTDLFAGAVIAFKELDIQNFQPVISEYRIARVQNVQRKGNKMPVIEVLLSKRDWPTGRHPSDPFAIEDEEDLPEDGVRVKSFADLIEPKLIKASSVQVSATPVEIANNNEASASLPQAQSSIIPDSREAVQDSAEMVAPPHSTLKETHVDINTPRRNEITAIIKEAGFDSAIAEDLLQPDGEPEAHAEPPSSPAFHTRSHRSQRPSRSPAPVDLQATTTGVTRPRFDSPGLNGWDSSPLRPIAADSNLLAPSQTSRQPTPEASKSQISVEYPALSQLELDASGVSVTNDSSFQDAQRVSQAPDMDTSNLQPDLDTSKLHPEYRYDDFGPDESAIEQEEMQHSLASELQESQSPSTAVQSIKKASNSFLGLGLDGQSSSDNDGSDFDSNSDYSLPSLRGMTSSQTQKIKHRSRVSPLTRTAKPFLSISPPPSARAKRLRNGKKRSSSSQRDDDVESRPIKASQSRAPLMSQIPTRSQIIDLTLGSDPPAPGSDEDYEESVSRRTRNATRNKTQRSFSSGSGSDSYEDDEDGAGIGKRKFLTTKKWRSHI